MRFQEFSKFTIRPHLFENKQQYKQIMDTMVNGGVLEQEGANDLLTEVRTLLKRADRIIWWLRWFRIDQTGLTVSINIAKIKDDADKSEDEKTQEIARLENLFKKITKKDYDYYKKSISNLRNFSDLFYLGRLEHWSAMFEQSPQVNQIEWEANLEPIELLRQLAQAEQEWEQKQEQELEMEPDDQIIIDYGKYAWVKLDRAYCELEGRAMGHCGNTATPKEGDRILSFRTKVSGEKQRPHLTFILDKNGYLGEMKGRANEKPSEKYHPYIIDLLQKDFVKGIKGGGYLPEHNFSITDLDQEQMNALISEKPSLITPEEAYTYAVEKVEGRWPEGEEVIAQSPKYALYYALNVIKGRWPEGEEAIKRSKYAYAHAYVYAKDIINDRWPEAEDIIKTEPDMAYAYARDVIQGRWPEAEEVIAKESYVAYIYARDVIRGRFPEGEETIKQHPKYAYFYAKDIIGGRWPEGEEAIKRVGPFWEEYIEFLENNDE